MAFLGLGYELPACQVCLDLMNQISLSSLIGRSSIVLLQSNIQHILGVPYEDPLSSLRPHLLVTCNKQSEIITFVVITRADLVRCSLQLFCKKSLLTYSS